MGEAFSKPLCAKEIAYHPNPNHNSYHVFFCTVSKPNYHLVPPFMQSALHQMTSLGHYLYNNSSHPPPTSFSGAYFCSHFPQGLDLHVDLYV